MKDTLRCALGRASWVLVGVLGACSPLSGCANCSGPDKTAKASVGEPPHPLRAQLDALRKGGKSQIRYLTPEPEERDRYAAWVTDALHAASEGKPPPKAPKGFALRAIDNPSVWLLHETADQRRGAGAVVLRVGEAQPVVVEAPHTFFDAGTLPLSLDAFTYLKARALVINTAHRANRALGASPEMIKAQARTGALASDAAHAKDSFFMSAHGALTETLAEAPVLQLHGFRDEEVAYDAIISAAGGTFDVMPLTGWLQEAIPKARIAAYPEQVKRMGGTSNAQAELSRRDGKPFVHIELSRSMRTRLLEEPKTRRHLLEALSRALVSS